MRNFTENAIKESFLKLLEKRPLNKITVRDIVQDCGINRNTFYYHFQDIPSLLERTIADETEAIILQYPTLSTLEECLHATLSFAKAHRAAVLHIYRSPNRELYEQYIWRTCEHAVRLYYQSLFRSAQISDNDAETLIRYFKCLCFGFIMDWMENGMTDDIFTDSHRLLELRSGQLEEMIARCAPPPNPDKI